DVIVALPVGHRQAEQAAAQDDAPAVGQDDVELVHLVDQPGGLVATQDVVGVDEGDGEPRPGLHRLPDGVHERLIGQAGQADAEEFPLLCPVPGAESAGAAGHLAGRPHSSPSEASSCRSPASRSYSGFQPVACISFCGSEMRCPSPSRIRSGTWRTSTGCPVIPPMVSMTSSIVVPVPVPTLNTSRPGSPCAAATRPAAVSVTKIRSRWGHRFPSSMVFPARSAFITSGSTCGLVSRGP